MSPAFVLHVISADRTESTRSSSTRATIAIRRFCRRSDSLDPWDHAPGKGCDASVQRQPGRHGSAAYYGATVHDGTNSGRNKQRRDRICEAEGDAGRPHHDACASLHGYRLGATCSSSTAPQFVENEQPLLANAGLPGPAQTRATQNNVIDVPGPSRAAVSIRHSPCGTTEPLPVSCRSAGCSIPMERRSCRARTHAWRPGRKTAPPLYSVWMFDPQKNTLLPVMPPVEGTMVTDIVAAQPRALQTSSGQGSGSGYRSDAGDATWVSSTFEAFMTSTASTLQSRNTATLPIAGDGGVMAVRAGRDVSRG